MAERMIWEDPPYRSGPTSRTNHGVAATRLRRRPGRWGVVATYVTASSAASAANMVRTGKTASYTPAGAFEATARTVDGEHRVYARYVGADGKYRDVTSGEGDDE